jgi:AcrR family transcriptional regulator
MAVRKHRRRSQDQRSAATRERLLDAAIDCIVAHGYARTTTTMIARRARLTRGAQFHHFGNREQLVLAAIAHLFDRGRREFAAAFKDVSPGPDQNDIAIDLSWKFFSGRLATAWIEIMVAARSDPRLKVAVQQRAADLQREVLEFGHSYSNLPLNEFALSQAFEAALMMGLAVMGMNLGAEEFGTVSSAILGLLKEFIRSLARDPGMLRRVLDRLTTISAPAVAVR